MANQKNHILNKKYQIDVPGGKIFAVKYYTNETKNQTPLLVLHGGPGAPLNMELPHQALANERPIILYDQLGSGKSERPTDKKLWRLPRFIKELETVVDFFELNQFHLLGHSWGGALALAYASKHAKKLKSLILASPLICSKTWVKDANFLRKQLPKKIQATLDKYEKVNDFMNPEYQKATHYFYNKHLCRLNPPPKEVQDTFKLMNIDIYITMWGYTEFNMQGNLKDLDLSPELAKLSIPVLFAVGRYDEARPKTMRDYLKKVPNGQLAIFNKSSHVPILEETALYLKTIKNFINKIDI